MATESNNVNITGIISAIANRISTVATEKVQSANTAINRELQIASLTQEKKKLLYELGAKIYERVKGETEEQPIPRLEQIDRELEKLQS